MRSLTVQRRWCKRPLTFGVHVFCVAASIAQLINGGHTDSAAIAERRDKINERFANLSTSADERKTVRAHVRFERPRSGR